MANIPSAQYTIVGEDGKVTPVWYRFFQDNGATGFQPLDADLTALAGLSSTGIAVRTASGTWSLRTITGTANKVTVSNGDGVAGNPTITIAATYIGQTSITTLGTISTGTWNGTKLSEVYGGTNQSTYTLGDILYSSASDTLSKLTGNITTTKKFLTQTGDGAASAAPSWNALASGDLSPLGAALTKGDDTNVTLTLGGTPSTALITASSITAGWTGQLGLTRGGTAASLTASNGGIVYSTASALAILSGTATAGKALLSGSSTTPVWSTPTYPSTSGTSGTFLISNGTNNVYSTSTIPTSAGATANKILLSDGTNYVLSTPTFPNASATTRKITVSDGTNWVASTETYAVPGTSGNILTSDGTNWTSAVPAPSDAQVTFTDITTNNSSTSKHGFLKKLDNTATNFMNGQGNWAAATVSGAALTKTDDTNVTATLGGSPTTALVNAASITLGWTGSLSVARGGNGVTAIQSFHAYNNSATTLAASAFTKVAFQATSWNTGSAYDAATNYRFTPTVAGVYQVNAMILLNNSILNTLYGLSIFKNGASHRYGAFGYVGVSTETPGFIVSALVAMNGSTDYIEIYGYNGHAITTTTVGLNLVDNTYFEAIWVGP